MVHVKSFLPDPPELPPTNIHAFFIEPREMVDKDYVFLIDGLTGEQWTRSYFKERVDRARTALDMSVERKGLGLQQSDMVAILSENCTVCNFFLIGINSDLTPHFFVRNMSR
jgi:hypothetical protein